MHSSLSTTAREAFERGDEVLQLALPLLQQSGRVIPMVRGETSSRRSDVTTELNRVVCQGWALTAASVVFVPTGEVSRDKFFSSGQNVAVSGEVVGYYVFTRDETKRQSDEVPTAERVQHRPVRKPRPSHEIGPLQPLPE
jgi:hypothetical protein